MKHLIEKYQTEFDRTRERRLSLKPRTTERKQLLSKEIICEMVLKDLIVEDVARRKVIKIILIVSGLVYPMLTVGVILLLS